MIVICRTLLGLIIVSFLTFLIHNNGELTISSDLKDLSPELAHEADTQTAINTLSKHIESQITLIFSANKKLVLAKAVSESRRQLATHPSLILADTESLKAIVDRLKQHRFHLLTAPQKQALLAGDTAVLIDTARRNLFRMNPTLHVLPITEDPLGLFSEYLISLASQLPERAQAIQTLSRDGETLYYQALTATIKEGSLDYTASGELNQFLQTLNQQVTAKHPVNVLSSGVFFFAADAAEKSKSDVMLISIGSGAGVTVLLLLVFLSLSALIIPVCSIIIGIVFGITMSHVFYGSVHILTIVFGASLIGVIIDYSLHYFYHQSTCQQPAVLLKNNVSRHQTSVSRSNSAQSRKRLHGAMLISLLTSLIGYGALSFSTLDALRKIAVFSCFGVFAAWVSVIATSSLASPRPAAISLNIQTSVLTAINKGLACTDRFFSFSLWALLLLACAIYLYLIPAPVNDSPRLFFQPPKALLEQEQRASELIGGFEPGQYLIIKGNSGEQIYQRYAAFTAAIKDRIEPSALLSVMSLLPSVETQQKNYQLQRQLYEIPGASATFFSLVGMDTEAAEKLRSEYRANQNQQLAPEAFFSQGPNQPPIWMEIDGQLFSFVLIKKGTDTQVLQEASELTSHISYINTFELTQQALKSQRESATQLLLVAYGLIALLLVLIYRSLTIIRVLLVPLTATIGTVLLLASFGFEITLFSLMGLFLVLGLGMDYGIFSTEMAKEITITQPAILLSALTSALSFGLLSISSIPVAKAFGIVLLTGNTLNFLAALLYARLSVHNAGGANQSPNTE